MTDSFNNSKKAIALIFILFVKLCVLATPLAGVYTIGGKAPDYTTINDAVTDLIKNGISAPVNFKIRPGIYKENIKISSFNGASISATVTFESSTSNKNDVLISHEHLAQSTNENYTLFIDGVDYLIFKNLTFKANMNPNNSQNYNRVVYITSNSNHLLFEGNSFKSWRVKSGSSAYNDCIYMGSDYNTSLENDSNIFNNNAIYGGWIGLNLKGSASSTSNTSNWRITNNQFFDQTNKALSVNLAKNVFISGNFISGSVLGLNTGISITSIGDSLEVMANNIDLTISQIGLYLNNNLNGTANYGVIANNKITCSHGGISTAAFYGIQSSANQPLIIAHNSILINQSKGITYGIYSSTRDSISLINNQLINWSNGYAYYIINISSSKITSNFNNLYAPGIKFVHYDSSDYSDLSSLSAATGYEMNSLSVDPKFPNSKLLIPYNPTVFGVGTHLKQIKFDYFGNTRQTSPTLGYYEGTIPKIDAGIIHSLSDSSLLCPNELFAIYTDLNNYGSDTLTAVNIYFSVNDSIYPVKNWTGKLAKYEKENNVYLGTLSTNKQVNIKIWVSKPNGKNDEIILNDTLILNSFLAMNGNYSVGDSNSDFVNLSQAIEQLTQIGLCGPVILNIKSGVYKEQYTIPKIPGSSSKNTITIQAAEKDHNKVLFQFNAQSALTNFIFKLSESEFIHFKYLTIEPKGTNYNLGVLIENSSNNLITNCLFKGKAIASSSSYYFSCIRIVGGQIQANNNRISNNLIFQGGNQISIAGLKTKMGTGNQIDSNVFYGNAGRSLLIDGQENFTFLSNEVTGYRYDTEGGIYLTNCGEKINIDKNKLILSGLTLVLVVVKYSIASDSLPILIKNNFLSTLGTGLQKAVSLDNSSYLSIFNNSCNNSSNNAVSIELGYKLTDVKIQNNIFNHKNAGLIYNSTYDFDTTKIFSNNNAFYSPTLLPFNLKNIKYSFSQYQSNKNADLNSIFTIPYFISDTNLHVKNAVDIHQRGAYLKNVKDDIDGDIRSITPDIGADEFAIDSNTLGDIELVRLEVSDSIACKKIDSLILVIVNHAAFDVNYFYVKWWLFDVLQDSLLKNITLKSKDTIKINLGQYKVSDNTLYRFAFELSKPNGKEDFHFGNNTKQVNYYHLENVKIWSEKDPCETSTLLYIKTFPRAAIKWSDNSIGDRIRVNKTGTFSVTVKAQNGCSISNSIILK